MNDVNLLNDVIVQPVGDTVNVTHKNKIQLAVKLIQGGITVGILTLKFIGDA